MKVVHAAIDGSRVTVEGDLDLGAPFTTMGRIVAGYVVYELTVGPRTDVDALLAERSGGTTERFDYRDGLLQIASVERTDPATRASHVDVVATWTLGDQAVSGSFPGLGPEAVVAVLDTVEVDTTPELTLRPRGSRWYDDPQLVKEIPGLGLLEVRPHTRERAAELPDWKGSATRGGDLYRIDERPDAPALLLVSPTAVSHVLLDEAGTADAATASAGSLVVAWEQP